MMSEVKAFAAGTSPVLASFEHLGGWQDLRREVITSILPALPVLGFALILCAGIFPDPLYGSIPGMTLLALATAVGWTLKRSYHAAAWLLLLGFSAICLLGLQWYGAANVASLVALPVGLAVALFDVAGGLLAGALFSVALILGSAVGLHTPTGLERLVALSVTWGTVLLVWTSQRPTKVASAWAWSGYQRAHQLLEEARDRQLELAQIRQGLEERTRELARLSDRLRAMGRVAEEARKAKEQFVANVSHELRTPLNMIIGFSELISRAPQLYGGLPQALLADIAAIQRNSEHLASLVDDILDLSQVEADRMALQKETVSLPEVLTDAVLAVKALYESKGLFLRMMVPSELPALRCDRTRIRQVAMNLLSNAARFTEQGGVELHAWKEGSEMLVSVADTGPGIAAEDHARIFEPFRQVDGSLRRRHGGTGLGLSISKAIIELHRGKIWVESEVGRGATFFFSLPLDDPTPLPSGANRWINPYTTYQERVRVSLPPIPELKPRFVLVDEQDSLSHLIERYLDGTEVTSVRTLEEALRELERSPAQALIVNDPDQARGAPRMTPDIPNGTPLITCWVPGRREVAERLGVVDYLIKPLSRERLLSALEKLGEEVRTLLLVDDDAEVVQLFGRMINSSGHRYRLLRASSGERALDLLRERQPDAMLLDLVMPGLDGFSVLAEKNKCPDLRDIPVIVVSALDAIGNPIVSNTLAVSRSGGLSARELLACISAVSELLKLDDRAQPGKPRV